MHDYEVLLLREKVIINDLLTRARELDMKEYHEDWARQVLAAVNRALSYVRIEASQQALATIVEMRDEEVRNG